MVRDAVAQELRIDVFGEMWEGLAPPDMIRGVNVPNVDLPRFYRSADVVLNDHWDSMREHGFVSNRAFDVLACGVPLVTDFVAGLPEELARGCYFFSDEVPLADAVSRARAEREARHADYLRLAEHVRHNHSFDARAARMLAVIEDRLS